MESAYKRPLPEKTPLTAPYWDALEQDRICIQFSPSLNQYVFYPRERAPGTFADDLEWREISGMGTLYTYTIAYRAVAPQFAADVPQLLAIVEWDEGPRFTTELVNVSPDRIEVGMRVKPVFSHDPDLGITLLRYEPAA